jgi:Putative auto-transporter adhesin, head GIN domain
MATTAAPHRSGHPERHRPAAVIVPLVAALILAGIGVALLVHGNGSTGSGLQGSGVPATQTRVLARFSSLDLAGANDVSVVVGGPQSVVVQADSNLISHVTTRVAAGTLVIGETGGAFTTHSPMNVDVRVPSLTALNLSGAGKIAVTGISGPRLTVTVSGTGMLSATGTVSGLDVTVSGAGLAQLSQLTARDVHAVVTGSGLIKVTATASLNAAVPGRGAIMYSGNPARVTTSITGTGTVVSG